MQDLKFRFIKTEDSKGHWRTYRPQNNVASKLNSKKNVYVSVNKFLNYKERATYKFQNKLLFKYGLIDIDGQNFADFNAATEYFFDILQFLKESEISIEKIVCTNTTLGGYQIHIQPCWLFLDLLKNHPQRFLQTDSRVHDLKRVSRLENTWNGNRNCMAFEIPKDLNISELKEKLSYLRQGVSSSPLPFNALGMPQAIQKDMKQEDTSLSECCHSKDCFEANDNGVAEAALTPQHNKGRASHQEYASLPHIFMVKQLNSSIKPLKSLYVCVMKFRQKMTKTRLIKFQKAYNLGDVFAFKTHIGYCYVSPKAFQARRLEKIYRKAKCWQSLTELQKFRTNWIYSSNIYDLERFINVPTFEYLDFFANDTRGWFSSAMVKFLSKYHKVYYPEESLIGDERLRMFNAVFSTQ
mgnify:FL=1